MQIYNLLFVGRKFEEEDKNIAGSGFGEENSILLFVKQWLMDISRCDVGESPESLNLQIGIVKVVKHIEHVDNMPGIEINMIQIDSTCPDERIVIIVYNHHNIAHNLHMVYCLSFCLEWAISEGLPCWQCRDVHFYWPACLAERQQELCILLDTHFTAYFSSARSWDCNNVLY